MATKNISTASNLQPDYSFVYSCVSHRFLWLTLGNSLKHPSISFPFIEKFESPHIQLHIFEIMCSRSQFNLLFEISTRPMLHLQLEHVHFLSSVSFQGESSDREDKKPTLPSPKLLNQLPEVRIV